MSIQGDVQEHLDMMRLALEEAGEKAFVLGVKKSEQVKGLDALVIPGGESTTMSKLLTRFGMYGAVLKAVEDDDLPVLGTCAGCILLARHGDEEVKRTKTRLLGLMDMKVSRNSYGRQVDSFEADIGFPGMFRGKYHAVFIRAPSILEVRGKCRALARFEGEVIAAREGRRMALTFHPELTRDTRMHRYFLEAARE